MNTRIYMSDIELTNWIEYFKLTYSLTTPEQLKDAQVNINVLTKSAAKFKKILIELEEKSLESNLDILDIKIKGKQAKESKPDINEFARMFEEAMNNDLNEQS